MNDSHTATGPIAGLGEVERETVPKPATFELIEQANTVNARRLADLLNSVQEIGDALNGAAPHAVAEDRDSHPAMVQRLLDLAELQGNLIFQIEQAIDRIRHSLG